MAVLHGIPEERQSYQMLSSMEEGDWNKAKAISSAWVQHAKRSLTEAAASDGRDPDEGDLFATQRPLAKVVGKGRGAEIDGHTVVIRVNRLPRAPFVRDHGARTDSEHLA